MTAAHDITDELLEQAAIEQLWRLGNLSWKLWPQQHHIYETVKALPRHVLEIVFLCARQYGKCLEINTLVSTPRGPVKIQDLTPGQEIYGYNADGSVSITTVVAKEATGVRRVHKLMSHGRHIVSATPEHRFMSTWQDSKTAPRRESVLTTSQIIKGRARKIVRRLIDAPLGDVSCTHAYALGAMIGNGCSKAGGNRLYISSPDERVPNKVAQTLGVEHCYKNSGENYTWCLSTAPHTGEHSEVIRFDHDAWFRDKYSHEKYLDRAVIETWDRESCLKLLAGLTDTDGCVTMQSDGTLRWAYSTGSFTLASDVQWLVHRLFQKEPGVTNVVRRDVPEFTVHVISNLHASRIVQQISPYMVMEHKRWIAAYGDLEFHNAKPDCIGLTSDLEYETECYDIQVANETNLYVLHNEGLVTHNSVLGVILALEDCLTNPDVVVMIIAPTIKQSRDIVRPRIKLVTRDAPLGLIQQMKSDDTWYFANGSELKLGGFDTNSMAQRGKTIHKIYFEETADSDGDDYVDFLRSDLGPALTHSAHAQIIHLTTLPKVPDHPFATDTVPAAEVNGALFVYTIKHNLMLTPEKYAQCVKLCGGEHTTAFKREYMCQQVRDESTILAPEFDEAKHVRPSVAPEYCKYWIAGDFGGTRDMSVFHLMGYDFRRAKVVVFDERAFGPETGTGAIVAACRDMEGTRAVTRHVDVPGQLQVDLMVQHKYPCLLPRKDELEATVNQVRVALQNGEIEIDPKCKLLIATLRSGTFNKHRTDLNRTTALGHMDALMSLAYGLRSANKANPYPALGNANPHTHFIRPTDINRAHGLNALFKVR